MRISTIIASLFLVIPACASNIEPGTLTRTIRQNDDRRAYVQCIQQDARNNADLRRHCKRMSQLRWANWAWEDCMNAGIYECGNRPRYEDIP